MFENTFLWFSKEPELHSFTYPVRYLLPSVLIIVFCSSSCIPNFKLYLKGHSSRGQSVKKGLFYSSSVPSTPLLPDIPVRLYLSSQNFTLLTVSRRRLTPFSTTLCLPSDDRPSFRCTGVHSVLGLVSKFVVQIVGSKWFRILTKSLGNHFFFFFFRSGLSCPTSLNPVCN